MAGDFKLAELMRPCRRCKAARTPEVTYQSQQLCWDCANVYGGCEWAARFEPVPGMGCNSNNTDGQREVCREIFQRPCLPKIQEGMIEKCLEISA